MLVAFDHGERLIEYEGVALDWTSHYRQAMLTALQPTCCFAGDGSGSVTIKERMTKWYTFAAHFPNPPAKADLYFAADPLLVCLCASNES